MAAWYRVRIRSLMITGVSLLCVIVAALSTGSIQGALKFRKLTKHIRERGAELPLAANLSHEVNKLRATLWQCNVPTPHPGQFRALLSELTFPRYRFNDNLRLAEAALKKYVTRLDSIQSDLPEIADTEMERKLVTEMQSNFNRIYYLVQQRDWDFGGSLHLTELEEELERLQAAASSLPALMKNRVDEFAEQAREEYQTWLTLTVVMTVFGIALLAVLTLMFRRAIFQPLEKLLYGSRQVAAGNYDYRVALDSGDEMAELADALNAMTANFQAIKQHLNREVKLRTKEVVRSEQMASVGFLAAGVAHEINNPLATIAWSAEALESRLIEILKSGEGEVSPEQEREIATMKKYLRRIQDEAFRCKGITSSLLDFSRLGDAKKAPTSLAEIVESVIEMVRPLGRYRRRQIELACESHPRVLANPQEMKQVMLNLITNALDCVDDGGRVHVRLGTDGGNAQLVVTDDGCGMTDEVKQHLFEPFFTRRKEGQGTGLGLSITYRIVDEHGGKIEPFSAGPGMGSTFTITLPLYQYEQKQPSAFAA